jgi:hypothetical protein
MLSPENVDETGGRRRPEISPMRRGQGFDSPQVHLDTVPVGGHEQTSIQARSISTTQKAGLERAMALTANVKAADPSAAQ